MQLQAPLIPQTPQALKPEIKKEKCEMCSAEYDYGIHGIKEGGAFSYYLCGEHYYEFKKSGQTFEYFGTSVRRGPKKNSQLGTGDDRLKRLAGESLGNTGQD